MSVDVETSVPDTQLSRKVVAFTVQRRCYAVPIEDVVEMTLLGEVEEIAGAPSAILGMMQRRDALIPILDLRSRIGLQDLEEEMRSLSSQLASEREKMKSWFGELARASNPAQIEALVAEGPPPSLGRWFEAFRTPNGSLAAEVASFGSLWSGLESAIEGYGESARRKDPVALRGELDLLVETGLQPILDLADRASSDLRERDRQMVVVLRGPKENLGLAVDRVDSVATIDASRIEPRPLQAWVVGEEDNDLLVRSVVRAGEGGDLIQILDVDQLMRSAGVETGV